MTASVVITSYNQRDMLVEAVESALAQTHRPHEIIVADDGSDDGSPAVIADLERRCPGLVRGICQPRKLGIPENRNAGLRLVTGRWVAVLDGDDLLHPRFLESLVGALEARPEAGVAYSNHTIADADGEHVRPKFAEPQPEGDIFAHISRGAFGLMRAMLVRTDLVRELGGMDPRFPKHDGFVFTLRLARLTRFVYVDDRLVTKRDHPGGDSKTFDEVARRRYLGEVYDVVCEEIADLPPADQATIQTRWKSRFNIVDERIAAASTSAAEPIGQEPAGDR